MRVRPTGRAKIVAVVAVACGALAAAAAVAIAVTVGDPQQPTRSSSPLVSIGQPIAPYRAGVPAEGWIEMRARGLDGRAAWGVLHHTFTKVRRGQLERNVCAEVLPERALRTYPLRDGGSCLVLRRGDEPPPVGLHRGSRDGVVLIAGLAARRVRRLVVEGPGGTYEVPLSRHRGFLLLYSNRARGTATLTAHLRDGSKRLSTIALPFESSDRAGSAEARDPGGRAPWVVSADYRKGGPRAGQTCAQFSSGDPRELELAAPICGDLAKHAVFADSTAYGPLPQLGAFSPGPRSPKRLMVWGAVAPGVRAVRVSGRGATRSLTPSKVGRAFITVYPASVDARDITLEVTVADGKVERHVAPRRLNVVGLRD
jgi:hypothetical protein